jgi:hypothetical protein
MKQASDQNARAYASKHQLRLAERLGFGMHGIIFAAEDNSKTGNTAVKAHHSLDPYLRERDVYLHLKAKEVAQIIGFNVPQIVRFDDELLVVEMSIVTRPFVLDFAGAYLRGVPEFSEDAWATWEADKQEQFESRWPEVQEVLAALEALGIHMVDVTPSNIAFADGLDPPGKHAHGQI